MNILIIYKKDTILITSNNADAGLNIGLTDYSSIDIICLSLTRSDDFISSTGTFLAKEFAKNNRVFFIDHPYSWKDFMNPSFKDVMEPHIDALLFGKNAFSNPQEFPAALTVVTAPLTIPINFLPKGFSYNTLLKINCWIA